MRRRRSAQLAGRVLRGPMGRFLVLARYRRTRPVRCCWSVRQRNGEAGGPASTMTSRAASPASTRHAALRTIAHGDEAVLANLVQRRLARAVKAGLSARRSGRGRAKASKRRSCSAQCGYPSGCGCRRAGRRRSACGRCRSERGFRPPGRRRCRLDVGIMIRAVGLIEWWEQVRHHSSSVVGSSS
jgi:hypothetical protein